MKTQGLTFIEIIISMAVMLILAGALVSNIQSTNRANRGALESVQTVTAARGYMEYIKSKWSSASIPTANPLTLSLTLNSLNTQGLNVSGLSGSTLVVTPNVGSATTCSSIHSTNCTINFSFTGYSTESDKSKIRVQYRLTLTPTNGSSQTYSMELGR